MKLVIIEGIGKRDTIKKYLGSEYEVVATKGHVRDLPQKTIGVNVRNNFEMQYTIMPDKQEIVKMLRDKSSQAEQIYLATDPDREGEAISWHLCNILNLDPGAPIRIEFNEITKNAIAKGLANPRAIDLNLVNAQQTRRVIDRLVGYRVSPKACKAISPNMSAGRVQSVALRLVVDRENEIRNFVPQEYWSMIANLFKGDSDLFRASLAKFKGKKYVPSCRDDVDNVLAALASNKYIVKNVKKSLSKVKPSAPFTTSTMQQDALNKLGLSLKKVTSCAQELYEGVTLGSEGKVALITYIRTDSVRVAPEAQAMAKDYIINNFGSQYVPKTPNVFKVKNSAQDAHEAIRPISLDRTPESVKQYLSNENYKLYKLIYNKFLASQMSEATFNSVVVEIDNGDYTFKCSGKTPVFDGFMKLSASNKKEKVKEDSDDEAESENNKLPELKEGDEVSCKDIETKQKFTKPNPRYTEASLVKEMEEKGIGRPATYTPTITLLTSRKYVEKEGKFLKPTEIGEKLIAFLIKGYEGLFNVHFTADMEGKLDKIANEGLDYLGVMKKFNDYLEKLVGQPVEPEMTDIDCDKCGHKMVKRVSKYGEFLACSNYPACKNIQNIYKVVAKCPKCGGDVIERRSKNGKIFYGCKEYPKCDFISWEIPLDEKCPKCGSYMTQKEFYGKPRKKCSNAECGHSESISNKVVDNGENS
ncbi:MAG: type I DNA topoisomerase [Clostridiales bacterium]|nr:type I DNA topoisomerase [Clostridiales bacterium]